MRMKKGHPTRRQRGWHRTSGSTVRRHTRSQSPRGPPPPFPGYLPVARTTGNGGNKSAYGSHVASAAAPPLPTQTWRTLMSSSAFRTAGRKRLHIPSIKNTWQRRAAGTGQGHAGVRTTERVHRGEHGHTKQPYPFGLGRRRKGRGLGAVDSDGLLAHDGLARLDAGHGGREVRGVHGAHVHNVDVLPRHEVGIASARCHGSALLRRKGRSKGLGASQVTARGARGDYSSRRLHEGWD